MSEISERYRKVAGRFTEVAVAVPDDAWDSPAPCEGWVARDVVSHMVDWFPPFLESGARIEMPRGPSPDDDPAGAWIVFTDNVQSLLDDPQIASGEFSHPQVGTHTIENAISMFFLSDVLIHTWDLARATGADDTLDPDEVHRMFSGVEPYDEMLRTSGHYGPRVLVPDDADEQTKLIAFMGRQP
ncbi:MAG TPA: TIGR03086 family metal-binding protein [Ilumatobacteraceae bacterium]|nr:TIGR03086 family metal-binding protein [Ilumatobacteraceae bacterium]